MFLFLWSAITFISRYKRAVIRNMSRHQTASHGIRPFWVPEAGNGEANVHLAVEKKSAVGSST